MIFKNAFSDNIKSKLIIIENDNNVLLLLKIHKTVDGVIVQC